MVVPRRLLHLGWRVSCMFKMWHIQIGTNPKSCWNRPASNSFPYQVTVISLTHQVHESLNDLIVPLDDLVPLQGNPRSGNVDAIMASYREFGQVKPVVIRDNGDGSFTVIAGNHQVEAARRLGWTEIAAVKMAGDMSTAVAFALADNRTTELGVSDSGAVYELMQTINNDYTDLFDGLGWDEFEIATYEEASFSNNLTNDAVGTSSYLPPTVQDIATPDFKPTIEEDADGEKRIVAGGDVDHKQVAIQGSGAVGQGAAPQAVVQYTLVFDEAQQQRRWYDFIRWLRNDAGYDGDTTAQKIMSFIDAHSEV